METKCYAVDTWTGDEHAGFYNEDVFKEFSVYHDHLYGGFSNLLRMTFDEAVSYFSDSSIDLLHIDGMHSYDAVRHDFETWMPRVSSKGVVILHDINVRENEFGVWQLWEELRPDFPNIEFHHSHGLGVLFVGTDYPEKFQSFLSEMQVSCNYTLLKKYFQHLGEGLVANQDKIYMLTLMEMELRQSLAERDNHLSCLNGTITEIYQSKSWRVTAPIRFLGKQLKADKRVRR